MAARHLRHYGYRPSVYYPRPGQGELFARLAAQLRQLAVPFVDDDFSAALAASDCVVDALFGFSYAGPLRAPFAAAVAGLRDAPVPVLAVDAPSSWHIDAGPPDDEPGRGYCPAALVSLTAPKPLAAHFRGRHFIGGR